MSDRLIGIGLMITTVLAYLYYTFWLLITPFIDADQPVHKWFPHRQYALTVPLVLFVLMLTVVGSFLGIVMILSKAPEKRKVE